MINNRADFVLLSELADALRDFAAIRAAVAVDFHDHELHVTVAVPQDAGLEVVELGHRLAYLAGLGQVRAFATQYHVDPDALERLLPGRSPTAGGAVPAGEDGPLARPLSPSTERPQNV